MIFNNQKEIGSEFWNIPLSSESNRLFSESTDWFLSGRCALRQIVKDIKAKHKVKNVALPSWCCDSMISPFSDSGIETRFYPVYIKNGVLIEELDNFQDCDVIFLIDYFGYSNSRIYEKKENSIVVRDITHSVFSKSYSDADYYFGSLRKWAGFIGGGFALGTNIDSLPRENRFISLRKEAMRKKSAYISGSGSKNYLEIFEEAENILDKCNIAASDPGDINCANLLDVGFMRDTRRKNASILMEAFSDLVIFPSLNDADVPLFVPIVLEEEKRNSLRKHLIENSIYCPVHWPLSSYHKHLDERCLRLYSGELSLVCDQRYNENDMDRMVEIIKNFLKR